MSADRLLAVIPFGLLALAFIACAVVATVRTWIHHPPAAHGPRTATRHDREAFLERRSGERRTE